MRRAWILPQVTTIGHLMTRKGHVVREKGWLIRADRQSQTSPDVFQLCPCSAADWTGCRQQFAEVEALRDKLRRSAGRLRARSSLITHGARSKLKPNLPAWGEQRSCKCLSRLPDHPLVELPEPTPTTVRQRVSFEPGCRECCPIS